MATPRPPWTTSPNVLGTFDSAIVRCIAGEFTEEFLVRVTESAGVDVHRRMAGLLSKHIHMNPDELSRLGTKQRQRLANDIVKAEMASRGTMPGALAPLRVLSRAVTKDGTRS